MEGSEQHDFAAAVIDNTVPVVREIIKHFKEFHLFQDELQMDCEQDLKILQTFLDDIHGTMFSDALKSICMDDKEEGGLKDLQKETNILKQMQNDLESKIANNEKVLGKQKKDLQKFETDPKLQTLRDTIQAWKLATKIHFVYEGTSNQCGYGIGPTGTMKPFSYNPEEKTQTDITSALYEGMRRGNSFSS